MNGRRRRQIEEIAARVLRDSEIFEAPVNPDLIARKHGITVKKYELGPDVSGVLVLKDGNVTIGLNPIDPNVRSRFTLAHELGHYFLEHQRGGLFVDNSRQFAVMYRDSQSSTGEILQEQEANAFAAALLMPKSILIKEIQTYKFDLTEEGELKKLAERFKVSSQAMAIRIANLGLF